MRIVVIPDIHQAGNVVTDVEGAIAREAPDLTVFLGDYFDAWYDTPEESERTARWLQASLRTPHRVHLLGNHDLAYRFPQATEAYCSGFTPEKSAVINAVLMPTDWESLRFTYWHNDRLLFSHAGWSTHMAPPGETNITPLRTYLDAAEVDAIGALQRNEPHWFCAVGRRRGGGGPAGGLLWCDFREFKPIPGLSQIFGHTPRNCGTVVRGQHSVNICLDTSDRTTGVNHYIVVDTSVGQQTATVRHIRGHAVRVINLE